MQNRMGKSLILFILPALPPKLFFEGLDLKERVRNSKTLNKQKVEL